MASYRARPVRRLLVLVAGVGAGALTAVFFPDLIDREDHWKGKFVWLGVLLVVAVAGVLVEKAWKKRRGAEPS